ncbi:hypothetical protein [Pectobacterium aroidearum]|uniref:hypothetical protein n=1 Tax=Pectobacterium aroidearum TaxID=1201031 RepID=UPI002A818ABB|nr:hypothetical protein [Pectobacterium aroidearum]MDY4387903.1 hypothetical protein [Pectobacterium aroidearum]
MLEPQLETDFLLNQLIPSMEGGDNLLTEFEIMGIIRKARRTPDRHEGLLVEGLAQLVAGRMEEGIELCERSISLNKYDHVAWLNFGVTVASRGYHKLQSDLLSRAMEYDLVDVHIKALSMGTFWLDEDMFNRALSFLIKTGVYNTALDDKKKSEVKFMQKLSSNMTLLSPFAQIAKDIADEARLTTANSNLYGDEEHGYCYALYIKGADCKTLIDLNDLALEKIIEKNLHTRDCITLFVSEDK